MMTKMEYMRRKYKVPATRGKTVLYNGRLATVCEAKTIRTLILRAAGQKISVDMPSDEIIWNWEEREPPTLAESFMRRKERGIIMQSVEKYECRNCEERCQFYDHEPALSGCFCQITGDPIPVADLKKISVCEDMPVLADHLTDR